MDVFWEIAVCSLVDSALIMEAVSFSETSVSIYQTTCCHIPEDNHVHTCRHEHIKSHKFRLAVINVKPYLLFRP
jgi:hypothetical protein